MEIKVKQQALFSLKNNIEKLECRLLQFYLALLGLSIFQFTREFTYNLWNCQPQFVCNFSYTYIYYKIFISVNGKESIWISLWEKVPFDMCAQRRLKSVCAFAQSDQSSLSESRNFAPLAIQNESSENSDQTARTRRLIWIFTGRTCPTVHFLIVAYLDWVVCRSLSCLLAWSTRHGVHVTGAGRHSSCAISEGNFPPCKQAETGKHNFVYCRNYDGKILLFWPPLGLPKVVLFVEIDIQYRIIRKKSFGTGRSCSQSVEWSLKGNATLKGIVL